MWLKVMNRLLNLDRFEEIRKVRKMSLKGSQYQPEWCVSFIRDGSVVGSADLVMDTEEEAEKFIREIAYAISKGQSLLEMYGEE